jgi:hypothetical protein
MRDNAIQTVNTQMPINVPNSRSGFRTEAKLAKNDKAVVAVVANDAFPACCTVQRSLSTSVSV